jgi:hypothetical protein
MNAKNLGPILIAAAMFPLASNVSAWRPFLPSTHGKITTEAVSSITKNQYPDIGLASDKLVKGSTSEKAHEGLHTKGGKPKDWWEGTREGTLGGVLANYQTFMLNEAYLNLGRIAHLTEDMAVPAHAANIPHDVFNPDGLESYAMDNTEFAPLPFIDNSRMPYEYYQELQDETRSRLASWNNPATGEPYWAAAENAPPLGQDATFGPTGRYNGNNKSFAASPIPELCKERLAMAAAYARAMFEAASKKLPPLVSGLAISGNVLSPGQKMEISFTILENRTKKVAYKVIVSQAGRTVLELASDILELGGPAKGEYLMREKATLSFAPGKTLKEGTYTLEVQLTDEDGNMVPAAVNTDSVKENDSQKAFSIVTTGMDAPTEVSFDDR